MHGLAEQLFQIPRSLTGDGVRRTLMHLRNDLPDLAILEIPTGTPAFDWETPFEWNVKEAFIEDENGRRIADYATNPLYLVGYSVPYDGVLDRQELEAHLYSLPDQPDAIPYVTSYYEKRWGFCLPDRLRKSLPDGRYHVRIDASLEAGSMTYGELLLPGREEKEVLLSSYICHPAQANDSLSGLVLAAALAKWLSEEERRYSYRILFLPETIGAIYYLSRHLEELKRRVIAGFVLTCVGDERAYTFMPSRRGGTLADRAAMHALKHAAPDCEMREFSDRGSDERQYCSPGVDLPIVSVMRSMYREFPEYHTSLDDLSLVTAAGLEGSLRIHQQILAAIEANALYQTTVLCEPRLGKYDLYPHTSLKGSALKARNLLNVYACCDGEQDLLTIADTLNLPFEECRMTASVLAERGLIVLSNSAKYS